MTAPLPSVQLGEERLRIEDVVRMAKGLARPALGASVKARMAESVALAERYRQGGGEIYGVTTSVGASVITLIPPGKAADFSLNVLRMHGCGTGAVLSELETAAVLVTRLASLSQGKSGIRPEVADLLCGLLDKRVLPRIPSEGSVGASGDLTPLSYVAAVLVGEREVWFEGKEVPARQALERVGLAPLTMGPKEALALMNGTSVALALACLGFVRAERVYRLSSLLSAAVAFSAHGNPEHVDAALHAARPHPGQAQVAAWMSDAMVEAGATTVAHLQDRYSIRCAPQVIGVLGDTLQFSRSWLEVEVNGVSDNPIVDVASGRVLHGGNFYGGHVGFVADALKVAVANVACLLDRQLLLLCNPAENDGLPRDLVGVVGPDAKLHNGFKAVTIAASALAAEALKVSLPASVFSRSTELHNQDKVPMATLGARELLRVLELTEQVCAMMTLAACQALDLRGEAAMSGPICRLHAEVRKIAPRLDGDRRMDVDIHAVMELFASGTLERAVWDKAKA